VLWLLEKLNFVFGDLDLEVGVLLFGVSVFSLEPSFSDLDKEGRQAVHERDHIGCDHQDVVQEE
jgi:hypothetical protein